MPTMDFQGMFHLFCQPEVLCSETFVFFAKKPTSRSKSPESSFNTTIPFKRAMNQREHFKGVHNPSSLERKVLLPTGQVGTLPLSSHKVIKLPQFLVRMVGEKALSSRLNPPSIVQTFKHFSAPRLSPNS